MSATPAPGSESSAQHLRAEKIALDADPALPPTRAWPTRSDVTSLVYPATRRFYVQRWRSFRESWISPNCAAPGMPEPPREDGPRACGCDGSAGFPEAVYGHMESERLWPVRADWYDEDKPERAFAPDVWRGLGPCPATSFSSVLHQFPAYSMDARAGRPWYRIEDAARVEMENAESLDMDVLPWLFPEDAARRPLTVPRLVFEGAPTVELLHARWAVWSVYVLRKRAFVSYEMVASNAARAALAGNAIGFDRMRRAYYFGYNAVGAWFDRTPEQVGIIRHFISLGIPVYYRWELQYADKQKLADLRPRQTPDEDPVVVPTPMSPLRGPSPASASTSLNAITLVAPLNPELHWCSARRVPRGAKDEYGYTLAEDEEDVDLFDQQEFERASSVVRASPAPSTAPSQVTSAASAAPSSRATTSSGAASVTAPAPAPAPTPAPALAPAPAPTPATASAPPINTAVLSWAHRNVTRPGRIPLQRRISMVETGVGWFTVPNVLEYFRQLPEYKLDDEGKHLEGPGYFEGIDWHTRLIAPLWLPASFLARRNSRTQNQLEQVEMAFRYGVAFQTLIPDWIPPNPPTPSPVDGFGFLEAYLRAHAHELPDELRFVDGNPPNSLLRNWAAIWELFCLRPHARAALEAGGLIARLARWAGLTLTDALKGPSEDVRQWGTSHPVEELVNQRVVNVMDDWLEPHEVAALYGRVDRPDQKIVSLWPDPDQFKRNWFNERGTWTLAMEIWFIGRLEELWKSRKKPILKSRAEWREEIRERKREEDTALAMLG